MHNVKLVLEYDGTAFHGWQRQQGVRTVEGALAEALRTLYRDDVELQGASRTDRGVHAFAQAVSFAADDSIPLDRLDIAINSHLPGDVRVRRADRVADDFNARFSAVGKHYRYLVQAGVERVFLSRFALSLGHRRRSENLDVDAMRRAGADLCGEHDFAAFQCQSDNAPVTTVRTVDAIDVWRDGPFLVFDVCGRSFLYKMVRSLVGTLLEIGRGRWPVDEAAAILSGRERRRAGPTAPAEGLTLAEVFYDETLYRRRLHARPPVWGLYTAPSEGSSADGTDDGLD